MHKEPSGLPGRSPRAWVNRWKWRIKRYSNIHIQAAKPNVFVFSTARSGSTWLMEIIASERGIKFISEPLYLAQFREGGPLPSSWEFLLPHAQREPALENYFRQLLENRLGVGSPAPFSRFHRFVSRRIVVKDLRCHDLMNWFEERFQFQIVYLIRHPLPTALSRKSYARLPLFLSNDIYCERFLTPELRAYGWSILDRGTELEKKVLDWCLQNLPPLKFLDRSRWLCLHYEDVVLEPAATIDRLADFLGLVDKEKMRRQANVASRSTSSSEPETQRFLAQAPSDHDRLYLINRWRSKVSREEEGRAFEILRRFEIDLYEPDEDLPANRL